MEAVGMEAGGQDQAAIVTGHQASRDARLDARGGWAVSGEVELVQA